MHAPLHNLKPLPHWHWLPEQMAFIGHSAVMQQPLVGMHWVPHALNVALHWMPHLVPSQVAEPFEGVGQGVQEVPHEFTSLFGAQAPSQSCVIAGHWFMHAFCVGIQVPAQSFWPIGQVAPHLVPSQVASPPLGGMQAEHEVPQCFGSRLLTQAPVHSCCPDGQLHVPSLQVAPFAQSRASQHWLDGMHWVPQLFVPSLHAQTLLTQDSPDLHWVESQHPPGGTQVEPQWT